MENQNNYKDALLGQHARQCVPIPVSGKKDSEWPQGEFHLLTGHQTVLNTSKRRNFLDSKKLSEDNMMQVLEESVQTVYNSIYEVDTDDKLFDSIDDVRDLPYDTILFLSELYLKFAQKFNPAFRDLDEKELDSLKKKLTNGEELSGLSYLHLQSLCLHLVECLSVFEPPVPSSSDQNQETSPQPSGLSTKPSQNKSSESTPNESKPTIMVAPEKE